MEEELALLDPLYYLYQEQGPSTIQEILAERCGADNVSELLVKYRSGSYQGAEWVEKKTVLECEKSAAIYREVEDRLTQKPTFNDRFLEVDRLIAVRDFEGVKDYLVKWKGLDYDNLSWEPATQIPKQKIREFDDWNSMAFMAEAYDARVEACGEWITIPEFPPSRSGHLVDQVQVQGINFLLKSFFESRNSVMADETAREDQVCIFLRYLCEAEEVRGPFLIVTNDIDKWIHLLHDWTNLYHITYARTSERKTAVQRYELYDDELRIKFNVMLTAPEDYVQEPYFYIGIPWRCVICDGFFQGMNVLPSLKVALRDPMVEISMADLAELARVVDEEGYMLLCDGNQFDDPSVEYETLIAPLMLKRLNRDLDSSNENAVIEYVVECGMTKRQLDFLRAINDMHTATVFKSSDVQAVSSGKTGVGLSVVFSDVKRATNHPYLLNGALESIHNEVAASIGGTDKFLRIALLEARVASSGKFVVMDRILAKMKEENQRVVIYSHMPRMLDIIQDYCRSMSYFYERIDGNVRGEDRENAIDRFNADNSTAFVCLLSATSCADLKLRNVSVAVIYDGDWNCYSILQSAAKSMDSRSEPLRVYRLVSRGSYETAMVARAQYRQQHENSNISRMAEMDRMLKFGIHYMKRGYDRSSDEEDINSLLMCAMTRVHVFDDDSEHRDVDCVLLGKTIPMGSIDIENAENWTDFETYIHEEEVESPYRTSLGGDLFEQCIDIDVVNDLCSQTHCWDASDLKKFISAFSRFGWGRWKKISGMVNASLSTDQYRVIGICVIDCLLRISSKSNAVVARLRAMCHRPDYDEERRGFLTEKKDALCSAIGSSADTILDKLEIMCFINALVSTCPSETGLVYPDITCSISEWRPGFDEKLLSHVFMYGLGEYDALRLSTNEDITDEMINVRLMEIIKGVKKLYLRIKATRTEKVAFCYDIIRLARLMWTASEQRKAVYFLINYGYPDASTFGEVMGSHRSRADIDKFIGYIILYCQGSRDYSHNLIEAITPDTVAQINERISFFKLVRRLARNMDIPEDDKKVIDLVAENGFINIRMNREITARFGESFLEEKLICFMKGLQVRKEPSKPKENTLSVAKRKSAVPIAHPSLSNPRSIKSACQDAKVERDRMGNVILPMDLTKSTKLISLGTVVYNRPGFHTTRYIYPAGYEVHRKYASVHNPKERVWYRSMIIDTGEPDPLFRVEMVDDPSVVFEGGSPSTVWLGVLRVINSEKKRTSNNRASISGPESYCLSWPIITKLIQELPNAEKCSNCIFRSTDGDAPVKDEGGGDE